MACTPSRMQVQTSVTPGHKCPIHIYPVSNTEKPLAYINLDKSMLLLIQEILCARKMRK